jgi:hypothetical protein
MVKIGIYFDLMWTILLSIHCGIGQHQNMLGYFYIQLAYNVETKNG